MKNKKIILFTVILSIVAVLVSYGINGPSNASSTSDSHNTADSQSEFTFSATELPDESKSYPESHDGKNYYVSADGGFEEDGADGSIDRPFSLERIRWFSRDKAEDAEPFFKAGDQILLKRGDVFTTNLELNYCRGEDGNPITVASYGDSDKRPIIEITDRRLGGSYQLNENTGSLAGVILNRCSNIVVRDLEINIKWKSRKSSLALSAGGISAEYDRVGERKYKNIYMINNVIHSECPDTENPYDANTFGIKVNSYEISYETTPDDFVLRGVYVEGNHVYNVGRTGIVAHGWIQNDSMPQIKFTCFTDVHLDNNVVHDVGTIGIYAGATTGCTMNRNLVYNTGMYVCDLQAEEDPQEGEGGLMSMCLKDGEIKYNVTYNNHRQGILNDGIGIDIDWDSSDIVVGYNHVYGCDGSGIGTMANYNCKIVGNRVENNRIMTNHPGQISVCDFVPFGDAGAKAREYIANNSPDLLTVKNLEIAENFISAAPENGTGVNPSFPNKSMFYCRRGNGVGNWSGNSFHDNHVAYTGDGGNFFYNLITNENNDLQFTVFWDKFYKNQYFAKTLSPFNCLDETAYTLHEGASLVPVCTDFASWAKRDLNSTFKTYAPEDQPGKPSNVKVEFKDGILTVQWDKPSGDIWHYNVYKTVEDEEVNYRNLLEQTKSTSFKFTPKEKEEFYIIVQAENNMGVAGEPLRVKISLK